MGNACLQILAHDDVNGGLLQQNEGQDDEPTATNERVYSDQTEQAQTMD